ncbi:MAG TPA: thioredoxin domain-containing protein [Dehalococcoidia bacterium]|nr:thioredoxin domain-containing protein [Dehalococcoidia bacterium]
MFARGAEPQLIQEYVDTGKVRYVFKHFAFLGDESYYAAEAAECAGEQGKFWEYHDLLFSRWQGEGKGTFLPDKLKGYAQEMGLEAQAFAVCLDSRRYQAAVLADKSEGAQAGVKYTPSLFLNGQLMAAPRDYQDLKTAIEAKLAAQ